MGRGVESRFDNTKLEQSFASPIPAEITFRAH